MNSPQMKLYQQLRCVRIRTGLKISLPKSLKGEIVKICNKQDILRAEFCPELVTGPPILRLFLCLGHVQFGMGRADLSSSERFKSRKTVLCNC